MDQVKLKDLSEMINNQLSAVQNKNSIVDINTCFLQAIKRLLKEIESGLSPDVFDAYKKNEDELNFLFMEFCEVALVACKFFDAVKPAIDPNGWLADKLVELNEATQRVKEEADALKLYELVNDLITADTVKREAVQEYEAQWGNIEKIRTTIRSSQHMYQIHYDENKEIFRKLQNKFDNPPKSFDTLVAAITQRIETINKELLYFDGQLLPLIEDMKITDQKFRNRVVDMQGEDN